MLVGLASFGEVISSPLPIFPRKEGFHCFIYLILNTKENQPTFRSELYPFGNGTGGGWGEVGW